MPQYASDVAENVRKIFFQESNTLAKYQVFGIVLTAGYALKHECLLNYIRPEAKRCLDDEIDAHISKLRNKNCSPEVIRGIGKIVFVIKVAGDVLDIEKNEEL